MRFFKFLGVIICIAALCSGCWDKRELEDNVFAVLLGLDISEDKGVTVTVAYPQTQPGGQDGEQADYAVMSAKANSFTDGLEMLRAELAGPLALHSVKTVVISQEFAVRGGISRALSELRRAQVKNTANIMVSAGAASDFISARVKEPDVLRREELLLERANGGVFYRPLMLLDLMINIMSADSAAMYAVSESEDGADDEGDGKAAEASAMAESSGKKGEPDMPVKSDGKTRICGLAVFRGDKMVGTLNSSEARIFIMLTGSKAKIKSRIEDGRPVFDITLLSDAENAPSLSDTRDFIEKIQREYGADILKLGNRPRVRNWRVNWREKYGEAEINVSIKIIAVPHHKSPQTT